MDVEFGCAAYIFAFWRSCQQRTVASERMAATPNGVAQPRVEDLGRDQVRIIDLRERGTASDAIGTARRSPNQRFGPYAQGPAVLPKPQQP
jgi:hypothetical protein